MDGQAIVVGMISALVVGVGTEEYKRWRDKGGSLSNPVAVVIFTLVAGFLLGWVLNGAGVGLLPTVVIGGLLGWLVERGISLRRARGGPGASAER